MIEAVFALGFWLGADTLPAIYLNLDDASQIEDFREVMTRASRLLIFAAVFQISDGLQVVTLGALRGLQDVKIPALITFVAYWLIGFPVCYYAGLKTSLGDQGIWLGLLVGLTASALMLYLRFRNLIQKKLED
jgi:MATE family multidrug resistance protein